ncbi:MAG: ATP-binding protein [Fidelibacterota bacterium]
MKRDIYSKLVEWKHSNRRKPLILKGARQVGKTHILHQFGKKEYDRIVYFNFEETPSLNELFEQTLNPTILLSKLSLQAGFDIKPKKDLIIFDEIQHSNSALNSLKYFNEKLNKYHIAAAGSLLGILLSKPRSFPVGKVNFLNMYPMTFIEFLVAVGKENLKELLESTQTAKPLPVLFHDELIRLLRIYTFTGGMPEVVCEYAQSGNFNQIRAIQKEILNAYLLDFTKHAKAINVPKINHVWESIPTHLAKENKKFVFSAIRKGAKSREYESAIQWLSDAGLIYKSYQISTPKYPLIGYANQHIYKVFALDVGLLGALSNLPLNKIVEGDRLFTEFKGAFIENYIAQQLVAHYNFDLFYWTSKGQAEVDFILPMENITPLEVKAGINPKSKSLKVYQQKYSPKITLRSTLLNLKQEQQIINIPLYAISQTSKLV